MNQENKSIYNTVLITGSTSGIGEALARQLSNKSTCLILTGRNKSKLSSLSKELTCKTHIVQCDLTSTQDILKF